MTDLLAPSLVGLAALLAVQQPAVPGGPVSDAEERERVLEAAREIVERVGYCALVTVDDDGRPQARAMDAFPPGSDFTVWLGTRRSTRKIEQIAADPRVTLFWLDAEGNGYVTLLGRASIVDDPDERAAHWKPEWEPFYDDAHRGDDYVLVEVVPERLEIVSLKHEVAADPRGWVPAIVDFE